MLDVPTLGPRMEALLTRLQEHDMHWLLQALEKRLTRAADDPPAEADAVLVRDGREGHLIWATEPMGSAMLLTAVVIDRAAGTLIPLDGRRIDAGDVQGAYDTRRELVDALPGMIDET